MKRAVFAASALSASILLHSATQVSAAAFLPGDLAVVRLGDGTGTLGNSATAAWLDEYTTSGALVQSIALPTAAAGANNALTFTGNSAAEGQIRLSADGQYLTVMGYN